MNPNEKFLKTLIYILIASMALLFFMIQPYNFYCHISKNCRPILLSEILPHKKGQQKLNFSFAAKIPKNLQNIVEFYPKETSQEIINGQNIINSYYLKNLSAKEIMVRAKYHINPLKADKYLDRIECLCFQSQVLEAGETIEMPINFVIKADIEKDPELRDLKAIEVSYDLLLLS